MLFWKFASFVLHIFTTPLKRYYSTKMWRFLLRPIGFVVRKWNLLWIIDHDFYMGMTAAKPGKRFLKFVRRNISGQMHALLRLLLFGRFLDSLLIFIESDPAASSKTSWTGILTLSQRSKRHLPHTLTVRSDSEALLQRFVFAQR